MNPVMEEWSEQESAERVRALLMSLPPAQREVLLLRVVVGLSATDAAQALGLTVGDVRLLQHLAIVTLRDCLEPAEEVDQELDRLRETGGNADPALIALAHIAAEVDRRGSAD